jgi:hypothetical protein
VSAGWRSRTFEEVGVDEVDDDQRDDETGEFFHRERRRKGWAGGRAGGRASVGRDGMGWNGRASRDRQRRYTS